MVIADLEERLYICEAKVSEYQESDLFRESIEYFDIEATVLYNKQYDSVDALRSFVRALMHSLKNYIFENCKLLAQHKADEN